ncbi:DUF3837 family protein [Lachnospiraceae bacterium 46-15]
MVLEIVKQAVQIKMSCKSECPLISEAEYCYACARALKEIGAPDSIWQEFRGASKVEQVREKLTPYFQEKRGEYAENPPMDRLLTLLVHCRVEGAITDEVRKLM